MNNDLLSLKELFDNMNSKFSYVMICKMETDCGVLPVSAVHFAVFPAGYRLYSALLLCVLYCS